MGQIGRFDGAATTMGGYQVSTIGGRRLLTLLDYGRRLPGEPDDFHRRPGDYDVEFEEEPPPEGWTLPYARVLRVVGPTGEPRPAPPPPPPPARRPTAEDDVAELLKIGGRARGGRVVERPRRPVSFEPIDGLVLAFSRAEDRDWFVERARRIGYDVAAVDVAGTAQYGTGGPPAARVTGSRRKRRVSRRRR